MVIQACCVEYMLMFYAEFRLTAQLKNLEETLVFFCLGETWVLIVYFMPRDPMNGTNCFMV